MNAIQVAGLLIAASGALCGRLGGLGVVATIGVVLGGAALVALASVDVSSFMPKPGVVTAKPVKADPFRDHLNDMVDIAESLRDGKSTRAVEQAAVIKNLIDDRYGMPIAEIQLVPLAKVSP